ncbi:L-threonine 3-dehydrogenase [Salisediminibacterium halotolerans]|uniref:L-threonine 3-dehydrogenase n=1 Tax=Salisediminibacterium halotolerans TaxID=517425 RepID=UPI000EB526E6|nr:L-threonine 3-dehydrogenase [Salisediminibacterium halotolerans]RLJ74148.1 L-threonine 3-dehydrogenase [Actinophytocola xinjiangensis]RPE87759.1 L-threonine 3-dehydrogenase [Salisediminibacterium halotolerans]TWG34985.1 L-threonine 3-dehydrogenase [Salisediminibacterium halotolerans]GEL09249.1 L-threonine 3-dehydrogenase [Salisediminibacterium halotolerans]
MGQTMKAIVKNRPEKGAELQEVPIPEIGDRDVLIEVKAASICGTDVHIYEWDQWSANRVKPPYVFGHEFAGVVVAKGRFVERVEVGDHVSAETHLVCGYCPQCLNGQAHICANTEIIGVDRDGSFAEYVALRADNVWKNDPALPFSEASIQEPFGNAVHTVLSKDVAGKSVAVIGCGPIGLMAVGIAKASGASQVLAFDVNEYRLDLAEQMGATRTVDSLREDPVHAAKALTSGNGVNVVCEMSGSPQAIDQAFKMVTNGGHMAILSLPVKPVTLDITNDIVFKGITVKGISGRKMYETWQQTAGLLQSGQVNVKPLITHHFPLEDFHKGFELMLEGNCGKVVLYP